MKLLTNWDADWLKRFDDVRCFDFVFLSRGDEDGPRLSNEFSSSWFSPKEYFILQNLCHRRALDQRTTSCNWSGSLRWEQIIIVEFYAELASCEAHFDLCTSSPAGHKPATVDVYMLWPMNYTWIYCVNYSSVEQRNRDCRALITTHRTVSELFFTKRFDGSPVSEFRMCFLWQLKPKYA